MFSLEISWFTTIVIAACIFCLARLWIVKVKSYPPGPIPLPIIGNLLSFRTKRHALYVIEDLRKKYGGMFTFWMGSEPVVIISDWNLMKEALITKSRDFAGRPRRIFGEIETGGHLGIVFSDFSAKWEIMRKIATIAVRKYAVTEKLRDLVCTTVDGSIQKMLKEEQPVNPEEILRLTTHNIIAESAFGQRYEAYEKEYTELKSCIELLINEFSVGLPSDVLPFLRPFYWHREQRFRKSMARFRSILLEKYKDHFASYQPGKIRDFTDAVIAARKEAEIEENSLCAQLTDDNLINIIVDLFVAGTHTTMTAILWLFLLLGNYEDVQKKMMAEIDEIIGSRMPRQEDKVKCHYTSAVMMEALRFKTIATFGADHKATCDTELGGYKIKEGTTVLFNLLAPHTDPKHWPEPMEFKPERFLEDDGLSQVRKDGYIPFGAGRRACLGEKLAQTEIFLAIVRVLQKCKITLPNGPGTADFGLTDMIFFIVPKPFEVCAKQRSDI